MTTHNLDTALIPIKAIKVGSRVRPVDQVFVEGLAADIAERGLQSPITVNKTRSGGKFDLEFGRHRLEAFKLAGMEEIPAFVTPPKTKADRLVGELLENLQRAELTALERCLSLSALKAVYLKKRKAKPSAQTEENLATLRDWYEAVAIRQHRSWKTTERQAIIGDKLDRKLTSRIAALEICDNQRDLETLSKYGAETQAKLVAAIEAEETVNSVAEAVAWVEGRNVEKPSATDTLLDRFNRAPKADRIALMLKATDDDFAEAALQRGFQLIPAEEVEAA
ncbi:MAG: ParB/RepB/Spo0J family partition protein [Magnetovibrionaceae bacterium]